MTQDVTIPPQDITAPIEGITMVTEQLSGMEKIWLATVVVRSENPEAATSPDSSETAPPSDGLSKILADPWDTLNPGAGLPETQPVTILFIYDKRNGNQRDTDLVAEGICGTTFLTVRNARPVTRVNSDNWEEASESLPAYYRSLPVSPEPIEVVAFDGLAYAHYHLSKEEVPVRGYRYAICRDPGHFPTLLNKKAREDGMKTRFAIIDDGSFRVLFQTDGNSPNMALAPGDITPCAKVTGTMTGDMFTMDSVMFIRYKQP